MRVEETKGRFGFHLTDGEDEHRKTEINVQIYVMSSSCSRVADLAISPHLMTDGEIDQFIDDAITALQAIRADAKRALTRANVR